MSAKGSGTRFASLNIHRSFTLRHSQACIFRHRSVKLKHGASLWICFVMMIIVIKCFCCEMTKQAPDSVQGDPVILQDLYTIKPQAAPKQGQA